MSLHSFIISKLTSMHKLVRLLTASFSSKLTTVRFSDGALRFLGAAAFLNGSDPEALTHSWHRKPGGEELGSVYFVFDEKVMGKELRETNGNIQL